jgi:hypothetical protein
MSDPFSVTGSAVGVVSLGVTICQGFLAYYGPYKSFHEDIEEVLARVQSLSSLMTVLHETVTTLPVAPAPSGPQPVDLATQNIELCQSGIQKLERILEKCRKNCPPSAQKVSKLKSQFDRLLYPFRQDTLVKVMDTVTWLQSNVDTSLQLLQM